MCFSNESRPIYWANRSPSPQKGKPMQSSDKRTDQLTQTVIKFHGGSWPPPMIKDDYCFRVVLYIFHQKFTASALVFIFHRPMCAYQILSGCSWQLFSLRINLPIITMTMAVDRKLLLLLDQQFKNQSYSVCYETVEENQRRLRKEKVKLGHFRSNFSFNQLFIHL